MQSYYGSLPAAKRIEVTECQRELHLTAAMGFARIAVESLLATRNFAEFAVR